MFDNIGAGFVDGQFDGIRFGVVHIGIARSLGGKFADGIQLFERGMKYFRAHGMTRPPHGPKVEAAQTDSRSMTTLKTANCRNHVLKRAEERRKTGQFQRIHDLLGDGGQHDLTPVIAFAVALTDQ